MSQLSPLVIENVSKQYKQGDREVAALRGVSLEVEKGKFLAIMGASGSGKSTLLYLMAGLTQVDGGKVLVNGQELGKLNDRKLTLFRRQNIGLVFQSFNLIPTLTAQENVLLPLMLERVNGQEGDERATKLLTNLGLGARTHHRPDAMSGGEQQRVAIARALVTDPAVILADEPTGNLDSTNSRSVCELLRDLCQNEGRTIVMVTHEPTVAAYAQEVAILRDGQLLTRFNTSDVNGSQGLAMRYQECLK